MDEQQDKVNSEVHQYTKFRTSRINGQDQVETKMELLGLSCR